MSKTNGQTESGEKTEGRTGRSRLNIIEWVETTRERRTET
jgi:hypothetical protein